MFFTYHRGPGWSSGGIFQTVGLGDNKLKLRRPVGADIGRVVIHGEPVTREAQLDMDEPDERVEVVDIERLAAVTIPSGPDTSSCDYRWSSIASGYLVKSITSRRTNLIMSRIIDVTIWPSSVFFALLVKMYPMLAPTMSCMNLDTLSLFGWPIWFIEPMTR